MDEYYGYKAGPTRNQMLARIILGGVLLFLIIAFLIWLLFFRNDSSNTGDKSKSADSSQESKDESTNDATPDNDPTPGNGEGSNDGQSSSSGANSGDGTASPATPGDTPDSGSSSTGSTDTPEDLSETGPGEVLALFAVAVIAGTAFRRHQLAKRS